MCRREVLELLGPVIVKELVGLALGLQLDLVFHLLAGDVLVHEALTAQVEEQIAVVADNAAAIGASATAHVVDHRGMPLLDGSTCPSTHLVTVADVGVGAGAVHVQRENLVAVFYASGGKVLHHVLVCQVVAGGDDNGFGIDLVVLARGGVLRVAARHSAGVIGDELECLGVEVDLGTGVLRSFEVVVLNGHQAAKANGRGVAGHILILDLVGIEHGVEVREDVVVALGLGNLFVGFFGDVDICRLQEPIQSLAGDIVVLADDAELAVVTALFHVHVDNGLLVHEAVAALPSGLSLAAKDRHVACSAVDLGAGLKSDDLGSSLGCGARCRNASAAQADDHDICAQRLACAVIDRGSLSQPGHRTRAVKAHRCGPATYGVCIQAGDRDDLGCAASKARCACDCA